MPQIKALVRSTIALLARSGATGRPPVPLVLVFLALATPPSASAQQGQAAAYPKREALRANTIGAEGSPSATIGRVRSFALTRSGRIYVLDAADRDVKVFDLTGRFIKGFGRRGRGPGEFEAPVSLEATNTSVVIRDALNGTLVFSADGKYLETRPRETPSDETYPMRFGMALVVTMPAIVKFRSRLAPPADIDRERLVLLRHPGLRVDTLARIRTDWVSVLNGAQSASVNSSGFGDAGAWAALGDSVVIVADGNTGAVRWYAIGRNGARVIRTEDLRRTGTRVSATEVAAREAQFNAGSWAVTGDGRVAPVQRRARIVDAPQTWSVATKILVSDDGTAWVGAPRMEVVRDGRVVSSLVRDNSWTVFPRSGSPFVVALPEDFELYAVRSSELYGIPLSGDAGLWVFRVGQR